MKLSRRRPFVARLQRDQTSSTANRVTMSFPQRRREKMTAHGFRANSRVVIFLQLLSVCFNCRLHYRLLSQVDGCYGNAL
ncbi:MAG: hypothetical protein HYX94_07935 [Chloroflexi bacterium]|nr:hypothetical protein [Chloroflexota bacterium]